jgi:hypothetical protein
MSYATFFTPPTMTPSKFPVLTTLEPALVLTLRILFTNLTLAIPVTQNWMLAAPL